MMRILDIFPTAWDRRQLAASSASWRDRFEVTYAEPSDDDCPWDYDVPAFVERTVAVHRGHIDGVFSSSDYPGATVAGDIARRLGLPGSSAETMVRASHKHYSRLAQGRAAPEATPRFALVDPRLSDGGIHDFAYPGFIKPVKGAFSVMSQRIDSADELRSFLVKPGLGEFRRVWVPMFDDIVRRLTTLERGGDWLILEELLHGHQVTVEGLVADGRITILGVVDSVLHANGSFRRFDYPSALPADVQSRMGDIATRVVRELALTASLFNIEMMWDEGRDLIHIIEVNPRIAGQFGDLYEKVDGKNSYALALEVAAGATPEVPSRRGRHALAASVPLRIFAPSRITHAPTPADRDAAEALFPGTLIWTKGATGDVLSDFETFEDGHSHRYAVINLGADDHEDLERRLQLVERRLGYAFAPL